MSAHVLPNERLIGDITQDIDGSVLFSLSNSSVAFQRLHRNKLTDYPLILEPDGYPDSASGGVAVDRHATIYESVQYVNFYYSTEHSFFEAVTVFPQGGKNGKFVNPFLNSDEPATAGATDSNGRYWSIYNFTFVGNVGALIVANATSAHPSATFVPIPPNYYQSEHFVLAITRGPGSNMWVSGQDADQPQTDHIFQVSSTGIVKTFAIANGTNARGLATDVHGNVWYTDPGHNKIGRLRLDGTYHEYPIPTPSADPQSIALGPDGALWFTESAANKIGRITLHGHITEYEIPVQGSPQGITGPNLDSTNCKRQHVWFIESNYPNDAVVKITERR